MTCQAQRGVGTLLSLENACGLPTTTWREKASLGSTLIALVVTIIISTKSPEDLEHIHEESRKQNCNQ